MEEAISKKLIICDQEGLFSVIAASMGPAPPKPVEEPREVITAVEPISDNSLLFTEKFQPRSLNEFIGNDGPLNQLRLWLSAFPKVQKRIALIGGPPGVGKSCGVTLLCHDLGWSTNELNASDVRSKSALDELFHAVDSLTFQPGNDRVGKTVLIFDEIDGMGAGDRGGISALAQFAKVTKVPIICICGGWNDTKLEPLTKVSLSVEFIKPVRFADALVQRFSAICAAEKIEATGQDLANLLVSADYDIRYCLSAIQFWSGSTAAGKDSGVTDVVQATLSIFSENSIDQKLDAYFVDYSRVPLYIEENLPFTSRGAWAEALENVSLGDQMEGFLRGNNSWGLLNAHAIVSSLLPASVSSQKVFSVRVPKVVQISSKHAKFMRYVSEIALRTSRSCSVPRSDIYGAFGFLLAWKLGTFLAEDGSNSEELLNMLEELELTKDDVDHLRELVCLVPDSIPKPSEAAAKKFAHLYKQRHNDEAKAGSTGSDVRADYLMRQPVKKVKK
jgi:replication factor C subunit 1